MFVQTLVPARRYRVVEMQSLQCIAWFCMSQGEERLPYVSYLSQRRTRGLPHVQYDRWRDCEAYELRDTGNVQTAGGLVRRSGCAWPNPTSSHVT